VVAVVNSHLGNPGSIHQSLMAPGQASAKIAEHQSP